MTSKNFPELKPCPFCGIEAILFKDNYAPEQWYVGCNKSADCIGWYERNVPFSSREFAIEGWNQRSTPPQTSQECPKCHTTWTMCECELKAELDKPSSDGEKLVPLSEEEVIKIINQVTDAVPTGLKLTFQYAQAICKRFSQPSGEKLEKIYYMLLTAEARYAQSKDGEELFLDVDDVLKIIGQPKPVQDDKDNFIWCYEGSSLGIISTIIPLGNSKSLKYAMEVKEGYNGKTKLYRLVKVEPEVLGGIDNKYDDEQIDMNIQGNHI